MSAPARPATLRAVAERAGVSVRTVSNVVNDYVHVAPTTRAAVQRAIDELGYRPNLAARQLRRGRTGLLGLVLPELVSPYFAEVAALVVRHAAGRGWTVLVDETGGDAAREGALLGRVGTSMVDGLVVSPWSLSPDDIAGAAGDLPVVILGERAAATVDRVAIDNVAAARDATAHLLATGRRRLGVIGLQPHLANATAVQRLRGVHEALAAAGVAPDPAREIATRTLHRDDGATATADLLARAPDVDGVVCFTDELALGVLRALADRGRSVPGDVAVIGIDDIEDGRFSVPRLSTVAPDKARIAEVAVDTLLRRVTGAPGDPTDVVAAHRLIVRESS
ncbi:transcriptional regulator, LacI family [Jatrophihabitans endophyticus]|uniref:Transcriptional regulator, LacI family n=1 Tax=Jatrophihabitans endophyticus TaxID=1206085 RepID=A0A1M5RPJ3_9ACTN|nr:LacI family DNA-binding transcriptional regulator [Jatrophihabitans endophyticus]SHH28129.1 transcriptional regulator, LacI family [Jatrophihabitans endophyticus]